MGETGNKRVREVGRFRGFGEDKKRWRWYIQPGRYNNCGRSKGAGWLWCSGWATASVSLREKLMQDAASCGGCVVGGAASSLWGKEKAYTK